MLTPLDRDLLQRHVTIDADGNVVGDADVSVTKQPAGGYVAQIGQRRIPFTVEGSQIGILGDHAHVEGGIHFHGENLRDKELIYLDTLLKRYTYWEQHYTPLAGIAEVRAAVKDGPRLDLPMPFTPPGFEKLVEHGFDARREIERVPVDDIREAIDEHQRIILLGDPGSGKTTALWRLAFDYASAARKDDRAPLPLIVSLGDYTDDTPFDTYLAGHLGPLASHLESYRAAGRLILLLDGLDEIPRIDHIERLSRIQEVLDRQSEEALVITCRALNYATSLQAKFKLEGLQRVEVSPLNETGISTFLRNYLGQTAGERLFWIMAGGDEVRDRWKTWQWAKGTWAEFWSEENHKKTRASQDVQPPYRQREPSLLALGRNPYLLLMIAQVYANAGGELPRNRGRLFIAFVDALLHREEKRSRGKWIEAERQKRALSALAYAMQEQPGLGTVVEREWALARFQEAMLDNGPEPSESSEAEKLLYLATCASLLNADDAGVRFFHQLLQGYFAAQELGRRIAEGKDLSSYWPPDRWWEPSGWEETVVLLAGMQPDASALVEDLAAVNPLLGARCLLEGDAQTGETARHRTAKALIARMTDGNQPTVARARAGDALARLGDPRFRANAWHLPDEPLLGFVEIPAGPFLMGSDETQDQDAFEEELPQHIVELPTYYLARYPVTVSQFQAFVQHRSYQAQGPWEQYSGPENHPVVAVTWYDAVEYCRWLTEKLRNWRGTPEPLATLLQRGSEGSPPWVVRLPTEAEWEKAARGNDGRLFSWGKESDPNRANYDETGIGTTNAVGCFPDGASPYGCLDMAGNAWEWTHSLWGESASPPNFGYPYCSEDGREDPSAAANVRRVLRGGSFYSGVWSIRCAYRDGDFPGYRGGTESFRVVIAPNLNI